MRLSSQPVHRYIPTWRTFVARIRPFAAWRYASQSDRDLSALVAPPYDVIPPELRASLLARDTHNAVALELPDGPLDPTAEGNRYATGRVAWDEWRKAGVLVQDEMPAIYVLEQTGTASGKAFRRRAFIAAVALEPFSAGVVLPHERTLPKALGDRFELLKATGANLSQVLGLFEDPEAASGVVFDDAISGEPIAQATDDADVTSRLWAITDAEKIARIEELLAPARIFIADGHHRYTVALAYRDLMRAGDESPAASDIGGADSPASEYLMMALVSIDDPELSVLPTHRVADTEGAFDADAFKQALSEQFVLEELAPGHPNHSLDGLDAPAFLVKTRADKRAFLARMRPEVDLDLVIDGNASSAWKSLDVAVLQELILGPLLDIHPDRPETLKRLGFVKDLHDALGSTAEHDVAFVLRPTGLDQMREIALGGEIMPQKSTYFYPKLLTGLLFRSAE